MIYASLAFLAGFVQGFLGIPLLRSIPAVADRALVAGGLKKPAQATRLVAVVCVALGIGLVHLALAVAVVQPLVRFAPESVDRASRAWFLGFFLGSVSFGFMPSRRT